MANGQGSLWLSESPTYFNLCNLSRVRYWLIDMSSTMQFVYITIKIMYVTAFANNADNGYICE